MRLALFGPPGAGKGTQAALMVERLGVKHISTGDIIRAAMAAGTELGQEARQYVTAGKLIPDALVRRLAEDALASIGCENFVLDGYPRTVVQAEWLNEFLSERGAPIEAVISLVLPEEVLVDRLSKRRVNKLTGESYHLEHKPPPDDVDPEIIIQRPDDQPEAIRKRLEVYRAETAPVEQYYRERGNLHEIDGFGEIEEIFGRIRTILNHES